MEQLSRQLTQAAIRAVEKMLKLPNGAELVHRMVEFVGNLNMLVAQGRRASDGRRAREMAELLELKDLFIRMATHELRRPLGIVKGYVSMLEEDFFGELPEEVRNALDHIGTGSREMDNLVESLAAITTLEGRRDALHLAPYRLGQLVAEAIRAVEMDAAAKKIRLDPQVSSPDPELEIDADRLRIALVNLLGNAIKYSPEGSTVTVSSIHQTAAEAVVAVNDQGPGIDPAVADSLFNAWQRGPAVNPPGLGLGLYIARRIVELHGGRVTVRSAPGQGSTFMVTLPR